MQYAAWRVSWIVLEPPVTTLQWRRQEMGQWRVLKSLIVDTDNHVKNTSLVPVVVQLQAATGSVSRSRILNPHRSLSTYGYFFLPPPKKEVMFSLRSVCLSVCRSDNWKSCERISISCAVELLRFVTSDDMTSSRHCMLKALSMSTKIQVVKPLWSLFGQFNSKLSTESVGSRRELVANSVHTADATQLDSWVMSASAVCIRH